MNIAINKGFLFEYAKKLKIYMNITVLLDFCQAVMA